MRRVKSILILFTALLLVSCNTTAKLAEPEIIQPRYPILLVHGFNERTTIPYPNSLVDLTKHLRLKGYNVYYADTDAFAKIEDNAYYITQAMDEILKENPGKEKINIIAYSKGGLDARYAVSIMGAGAYTASLTTLATPHRGSTAIDFFSTWWLTSNKFSVFLINTFGKLAGDRKEAYPDCLYQMGRDKMRIFNMICSDYPGVKYYSFASTVSSDYFHVFFGSSRDLVATVEGPNDGIVSEESAAWGEYLGTINCFSACDTDICHTDVVGLNIPHNNNFDHELFFEKLIKYLADNGF